MTHIQNPARGVALMFLAILLFTLMDATAKELILRYPAAQVIWVRFFGQLIIVVLILRQALPAMARTRFPKLHLARALTQVATAALFFFSLRHVGLAEATALTDTNPVLVTLGAALFLGEKLGPRRIFGILAALIGAMIIIRPGAGIFTWWSVLPMLAAISFATNSLLTRKLGQHEPVWTSMFWGAAFGSLAFGLALPFDWQPIAMGDVPVFAALGVIGSLGQLCIIRAFSIAEASLIAPFSYLGIVFATLWGYLFFGNLPDFWTVIGALVIVSAGLYVWSREIRQSRRTDRS